MFQATAHEAALLLRSIDHTELRASSSYGDIRRACLEALYYGLGAVTVHPVHCAQAACLLQGSTVRLVAVVGFPTGAFTVEGKAFEARDAILRGAAEVDYVVNIGALRAGNRSLIAREMDALRAATKGRTVKAILEASALADAEKVMACEIARDAGIDFVGTATGFASSTPSMDDVRLMRDAVGEQVKIKVSGDIRSASQARKLLDAGVVRLGTDAGFRIASDLMEQCQGAR